LQKKGPPPPIPQRSTSSPIVPSHAIEKFEHSNYRHPTPVKVRDRTYSFKLPVFSELFMDTQETFQFSTNEPVEIPTKPIFEQETQFPSPSATLRTQSSPLPVMRSMSKQAESPPMGSPNNEKKGVKGWALFGKKNVDSPRKDDSPRNKDFESLSHKEIEELFYAGIVCFFFNCLPLGTNAHYQ
jgi:hypothetical protein